MGLAIPFLLSSLAIRHFIGFFTRVRSQMLWISRASGVLLIAVGLLMVTNYFTILASYLQAWTPEVLRSRL
jgi:cytochrome c-type biogenesis protein